MSHNDNQSKIPLTPREAAKHLAVAYSTISNSRYTGTLCGVKAPAYVKRGKSIIYYQSTLDTWLAQFTEQHNTSQNIA